MFEDDRGDAKIHLPNVTDRCAEKFKFSETRLMA
jgi:hypothetical protein